MGKTARLMVALCAALALSLVVAASAFASVHVTSVTALSPALSASLISTGDSGWNHGNENDAMSPVLPVPGSDFAGWFNQDVSFNNLVLTDPDFDGDVIIASSWWQLSTDGVTWGANMPFVDAATASGEGLYSISATGSDDTTVDPDFNVTGTIMPAFGIDKTKPVSMSDLPAVPAGDPDAIPVYNGPAIVTISATDTLSGVENLQYSADGAPLDYAWDADPGQMFTVPVTFATPGLHSLSWRVFDNAGNVDSHSVMFWVRPVPFTPFVGLLVNQSGSRGRNVTFTGEVDPIATSAQLKITIKRWNSKAKKYFTFLTITETMPKFFDDYWVTVKLPGASRFRAVTTFAGGTSKTRFFRTR